MHLGLVVADLAGRETNLVLAKCLRDLAPALSRDAIVFKVDLAVLAELIKRIVLDELFNVAVYYFLKTKSALIYLHQVGFLADGLNVLRNFQKFFVVSLTSKVYYGDSVL